MKKLLLGALLLTGCVTSSDYEKDQKAQKAQAAELSGRLLKGEYLLEITQKAHCQSVGDQCMLAGVVITQIKKMPLNEDLLNQLRAYCSQEAQQCLLQLSNPDLLQGNVGAAE
jgi:PBP1b-binding outer membrane lipoprotein LpoB